MSSSYVQVNLVVIEATLFLFYMPVFKKNSKLKSSVHEFFVDIATMQCRVFLV